MRYTVLDSVSVARSHCAGFLHVFRAEGGKGRMTKVPLNIRRLVQANEVHAGAVGHVNDLQRANKVAARHERTAQRDEAGPSQRNCLAETNDGKIAAKQEYMLTKLEEKKSRLRELLMEEQAQLDLELRAMGLALAKASD